MTRRGENVSSKPYNSCSHSADPLLSMVSYEWLEAKQYIIKESSYAHYHALLTRYILPELGHYHCSELTINHINTFLKWLLQSDSYGHNMGLSTKTISDIRSVIKQILTYMKSQGYPCSITEQPMFFKHSHHQAQILSTSEQTRLEVYLVEHLSSFHLGILLTLYSGLRIGELCALQWQNISLDSGTIDVSKTIIRIQQPSNTESAKTKVIISTPKTDTSKRIIPLPSFIVNFLSHFQKENEAYLLTGTKQYMEPRVCLDKYKKILKAAEIPSYSFHTLRHTFATRCVEREFDIKSLSEILGHSSISTTLQMYVHPTLEMKRAQMERLNPLGINGHFQ